MEEKKERKIYLVCVPDKVTDCSDDGLEIDIDAIYDPNNRENSLCKHIYDLMEDEDLSEYINTKKPIPLEFGGLEGNAILRLAGKFFEYRLEAMRAGLYDGISWSYIPTYEDFIENKYEEIITSEAVKKKIPEFAKRYGVEMAEFNGTWEYIKKVGELMNYLNCEPGIQICRWGWEDKFSRLCDEPNNYPNKKKWLKALTSYVMEEQLSNEEWLDPTDESLWRMEDHDPEEFARIRKEVDSSSNEMIVDKNVEKLEINELIELFKKQKQAIEHEEEGEEIDD